MQWWEVLGFEKDMTPEETRRKGIVDKDEVHLTEFANRKAAAYLCHRLLGKRTEEGRRTNLVKRARW
jgi:hypothetical protein